MEILNITASIYLAEKRRLRRNEQANGSLIFVVLLADIEKVLKPKIVTDLKKILPKCYWKFLYVFDKKVSDMLPPFRLRIDYQILLDKNDEGREKIVPWLLLRNMLREELLVLRKTLTELLDKNFIRVSGSSAAVPILFVKKPGGGIRFYVDY